MKEKATDNEIDSGVPITMVVEHRLTNPQIESHVRTHLATKTLIEFEQLTFS